MRTAIVGMIWHRLSKDLFNSLICRHESDEPMPDQRRAFELLAVLMTSIGTQQVHAIRGTICRCNAGVLQSVYILSLREGGTVAQAANLLCVS